MDSEKVSELLVATETAIRLDPSNYHKFVEALEKDSSMQHLCGKLRSTCGECDNVFLSTCPLTSAWCSDVAQLKSLHTPQLVSSLPPNTSAGE